MFIEQRSNIKSNRNLSAFCTKNAIPLRSSLLSYANVDFACLFVKRFIEFRNSSPKTKTKIKSTFKDIKAVNQNKFRSHFWLWTQNILDKSVRLHKHLLAYCVNDKPDIENNYYCHNKQCIPHSHLPSVLFQSFVHFIIRIRFSFYCNTDVIRSNSKSALDSFSSFEILWYERRTVIQYSILRILHYRSSYRLNV